jgi:hypothetical protein
MTERTLNELAEAEIVPDMGGPNGWLVRFGEGDYDTVNKCAKNRLLIEGEVGIQDTVSYNGISVDFDLEADEIELHDGDDGIRVPAEKHENVLWAVRDEDGFRLKALFNDLYVPTVRHGLMDMLMPRFRHAESDIQKTDDGWLIDGEILVGWDASNSPVNVDETHVVRAGGTIPADTEKEAREITFDLPEERTVALPNGTRTNLDDVEMRFLTSVALIVGTPQTGLYDDGLADAIRDSTIEGFTDTKSGLHHGHGLGKHTLSQLGVTEEAQERLWYNSYDHTGVHELAVRENEFRDAPIDVFDDAPNDDTSKWNKIHSTKQKAPIPKRVRADLEDRYGE